MPYPSFRLSHANTLSTCRSTKCRFPAARFWWTSAAACQDRKCHWAVLVQCICPIRWSSTTPVADWRTSKWTLKVGKPKVVLQSRSCVPSSESIYFPLCLLFVVRLTILTFTLCVCVVLFSFRLQVAEDSCTRLLPSSHQATCILGIPRAVGALFSVLSSPNRRITKAISSLKYLHMNQPQLVYYFSECISSGHPVGQTFFFILTFLSLTLSEICCCLLINNVLCLR